MKIRFYDKKTGEDAVLGEDATEFVLSKEGTVQEFVQQPWACYCALSEREDVGIEFAFGNRDEDDTTIVCKNDGTISATNTRCGICDDFLDS